MKLEKLKDLAYCLETYGPTDWLGCHLNTDTDTDTDGYMTDEQASLGIEVGQCLLKLIEIAEAVKEMFLPYKELETKFAKERALFDLIVELEKE